MSTVHTEFLKRMEQRAGTQMFLSPQETKGCIYVIRELLQKLEATQATMLHAAEILEREAEVIRTTTVVVFDPLDVAGVVYRDMIDTAKKLRA